MKSWIAALGGSYGFTHDLGLLLDTLKGFGADCTSFSDLPDLTIFAVHFRYDDAGDDCGFPEREEVLEAKTGRSVVTGENFLPPGKASGSRKIK